MHANFSNGPMRESGDEAVFTKICEEFGKHIPECISVYGAHNEQRLTGRHENPSPSTSTATAFRPRRVDPNPDRNGQKTAGKVAWRIAVPASNADPYKVAAVIVSRSPRRHSPDLIADARASADRPGWHAIPAFFMPGNLSFRRCRTRS